MYGNLFVKQIKFPSPHPLDIPIHAHARQRRSEDFRKLFYSSKQIGFKLWNHLILIKFQKYIGLINFAEIRLKLDLNLAELLI